MTAIYYLLRKRNVLIALFIINLLGTVYGYYWYRHQLAASPAGFIPFIPDSPTASLFFVFVLAAFLLKIHVPWLEAFAAVTLFKYGVWAVGMNLAGGWLGDTLQFQNYMLIVSHASMAVEGLLFAPFYRFKPIHLLAAGVWTLHDVVIDYVFDMMPWYPILNEYKPFIGYLTFWLSLLSLFLVYQVALRKNRLKIEL
ncbi:MAG TPA: DUF1405 domain-containing protein [Bacillales bacterium]|nr:DUF1405 domain-containing protein [Bacillales bacterium]